MISRLMVLSDCSRTIQKVQRHYFCSYSYSRHGVPIQCLTFVWIGSCVHDVREVDSVLTVRERHVVPWRIICERSCVVACYLVSPDGFMLMFRFKHRYIFQKKHTILSHRVKTWICIPRFKIRNKLSRVTVVSTTVCGK